MAYPDRMLRNGEEILRCKDDFVYFCENYLQVLDRNSKLVPFKLKKAQLKLLLEIEKNPWQCVLKARQLGSSTLIAALFFWRTLFTPNERTLVIAHTAAAVSNIFRIYKNFYDNLPAFLKFDMKNSSAHEMIFFHGGTIRISSASGQSFRGATYNNLHCSEVAFWKDMSTTIAGLFQTATGNSHIILETTANGLNQFHALWVDEDNGFAKTFLAWTDEPEYVKYDSIEIPDILVGYCDENKLSMPQKRWAAEALSVKCANNFAIFQQEYAIDPITCFISSGSRFFDVVYPHAKWEIGYKEWSHPNKNSIYVLGADVASGSPHGDYSAYVILDVTNENHPEIVASYAGYHTPIEFGEKIYEEVKKWNCLAVIESNSYGLSVIEVLKRKEWGKIYTQQRFDTINSVWTEKLGYNTQTATRSILLSKLQSFVNGGMLDFKDDRIKFQANTFVYDDTGRPDHMRGCHDDLIFAVGLALQGVEQAIIEVYQEKRPAPKSVHEIIDIELKTGMPIKKLKAAGYFTDDEDEEQLVVKVPF